MADRDTLGIHSEFPSLPHSQCIFRILRDGQSVRKGEREEVGKGGERGREKNQLDGHMREGERERELDLAIDITIKRERA